ncbi:hypothetical protein C5167_006837 [Papaver somniferum]|uniref:Uncharacterized protein n=1 Tax=Papaver somniferum TaxID=3469 RepID=A0A4Y7JIP1_PAPSO|nr:hypothetical protein C5167_006837 [Papaver somniferum]
MKLIKSPAPPPYSSKLNHHHRAPPLLKCTGWTTKGKPQLKDVDWTRKILTPAAYVDISTTKYQSGEIEPHQITEV